LAGQLWGGSGLAAKDMSAAMLYDGFSIFPLMQLAGFGFCRREEAFDFIQGGRIGLGGELPLNTFGGSLSQGRLHALGHVAEAALQASGRAGVRQVADARHILVVAANTALILSSSPG
jgi:acetyl-CoA acetyltransferase